MQEIAPDLWHLRVYPLSSVNMYLAGGTLIDAGLPFAARAILKRLKHHHVRAHALTHAHPDHMGSSRAVCRARHIEFLCGVHDTETAEHGDMRGRVPDSGRWLLWLQHRVVRISGHPVTRQLREGDMVGGFTVIDSPGHTPGHVSFWREKDRVLIVGDVVSNVNVLKLRAGLHGPMRSFTMDTRLNRASAKKLAALKPRIVCFGHGPVLRDGARLEEFVD